MSKLYLLVILFAIEASFSVSAQNVMVVETKDNVIRKVNMNSIHQLIFTDANEKPVCPVAEAIDLGLASGTKWASWNVGASAPEEFGGYYSWGDTEEKDFYDWSTYNFFILDEDHSYCNNIGDDIAGTEYDVAHVKWGNGWSMPTMNQIVELMQTCKDYTYTTQNGVYGLLITGYNDASIFLPAAGYKWDFFVEFEGEYGFYWSSTNYKDDEYYTSAEQLLFTSGPWYYNPFQSDGARYAGQPVRAVTK